MAKDDEEKIAGHIGGGADLPDDPEPDDPLLGAPPDPTDGIAEYRKGRGHNKPQDLKATMDKIILAVRHGNYLETAAAFAGVDSRTIRNWMRKASKPRARGVFRWFSEEVRKAMAESEMRDLMLIGKAAQEGNWTAAAWRLERKYPHKYGRSDRVTLDGELTQTTREEKVAKFIIENADGTVLHERTVAAGDDGTPRQLPKGQEDVEDVEFTIEGPGGGGDDGGEEDADGG